MPPGAVRGQGGLRLDRFEGDRDAVLGVALLGDGSNEAVLVRDPQLGQRSVQVAGIGGILGQVGRSNPNPEAELASQITAAVTRSPS